MWVVEALAMRRLKAWSQKTPTTFDDFLVDRIHGTGIPLMANLRIYEEFEKRRIEFAYPTQTLYLAKT
jgi:hypothetical protein